MAFIDFESFDPCSIFDNSKLKSFNPLLPFHINTTLLETKILVEAWRNEWPPGFLGYRQLSPEAMLPAYKSIGPTLSVVQLCEAGHFNYFYNIF